MKIAMVKTRGGAFVPAFDRDKTMADKFGVGEVVEFDFKKQRNPGLHRKFFALVRMVMDNTEAFANDTDCRYYLTMRAGYYTFVKGKTGMVAVPKSINFGVMDDVEFAELFTKVCEVVEHEYGINNEQILLELNNFL